MALRSLLEKPAKRLGWLIAIWSSSVIALGVFALGFRFFMSLAGLTE
jgi:hypothetical protein